MFCLGAHAAFDFTTRQFDWWQRRRQRRRRRQPGRTYNRSAWHKHWTHLNRGARTRTCSRAASPMILDTPATPKTNHTRTQPKSIRTRVPKRPRRYIYIIFKWPVRVCLGRNGESRDKTYAENRRSTYIVQQTYASLVCIHTHTHKHTRARTRTHIFGNSPSVRACVRAPPSVIYRS